MNVPTEKIVRPVPEKCPQCHVPLPQGALTGLCPACLLAQGATAETATQPPSPPFEPPPISEIAALFPQLEIIRLLGKGGMGAVYQARQPALDRPVALKILPVTNGQTPGVAERFAREAKALARLQHPNIVALYEFGHAGAFHYFIMEYVDGLNLRQLQASARLAPRTALDIVPQICEALQYAHDQGVVHRDIKPENVLVTRDGKVKIADFGIAKIANQPTAMPLTVEGELMGTPHYMAPEQVERPSEVDHRADIFSLGVVFYEMLTGELPLGKFPPPSRKVQLDIRLDEIVMQALEKEPQRRYQHVSEVKTQIQHLAEPAPPAKDHILMRVPAWNAGVDYKSRATLFGFPWLHVATGINPDTGERRIATGVIAIGNVARGGIALGGVAIGGIAFGGLALGGIAFGGLGIGLVALAGMAVGLLAAFGGGAIAPVALGGGSIGYYGFGGGTLAKYGMSALGVDPEAWDFFQPWAGPLIDHSYPIFMGLVILSVFIGNSVPAWLQRHNKAATRQPAYWVQLGIPVLCLIFLTPILFISRPKLTGAFKAMISGETVSAPTGNPVRDVQIKILDPNNKVRFWFQTQSRADGTFSGLLDNTRLEKTKASIQATAEGYEPRVIALATNAFDSKGHMRLRFVLTPISSKSGSVTNAAAVTEE